MFISFANYIKAQFAPTDFALTLGPNGLDNQFGIMTLNPSNAQYRHVECACVYPFSDVSQDEFLGQPSTPTNFESFPSYFSKCFRASQNFFIPQLTSVKIGEAMRPCTYVQAAMRRAKSLGWDLIVVAPRAELASSIEQKDLELIIDSAFECWGKHRSECPSYVLIGLVEFIRGQADKDFSYALHKLKSVAGGYCLNVGPEDQLRSINNQVKLAESTFELNKFIANFDVLSDLTLTTPFLFSEELISKLEALARKTVDASPLLFQLSTSSSKKTSELALAALERLKGANPAY